MRYLIFILIPIFFVGCELFSAGDKDEIMNGFKITTIEEIPTNQWNSGIYFQATEESGLKVSSIEDVTNLLNAQIDNEVQIKSAWYKKRQPDCGTPNGIAYLIVIKPTIIIELWEMPGDNLSNIFELVTNTPRLECPYYVQNLQPINRYSNKTSSK